MLLAGYSALSIHPFMAVLIFNPGVCIGRRIQDDGAVQGLLADTLDPLFRLLLVRPIELFRASSFMLESQKLSTLQTVALVRAAKSAEQPLRMFCFLPRSLLRKCRPQ
jgi:hypothetical protein